MIKKSIKKALKGNNDPNLALLALRTSTGPESNTPLVTIFYNHTIRTLLPSLNKEVSQENKKLILSNSTQHQTTLSPLKINDSIHLHNGKTWNIMGKVIKKLDDIPQFYLIETNKGIRWRNQQHILSDQGRNSSKSRTIDEYNSIIVTRTTDVTKQSSKHKQYKQWIK